MSRQNVKKTPVNSSPAQSVDELRDVLPQKIKICCDISGQDPDLLVALHALYGCRIDLVGLPPSGKLNKLTPNDWPQKMAQDLKARGLPDYVVRIVKTRAELEPAELVVGLNSFSVSHNVKNLTGFLAAVVQRKSVVLTDIRNGSGGFAFFKDYGRIKEFTPWEYDGRVVKRVAVKVRNTPSETEAPDMPWSKIVQRLIGKDGFYRENDTHSFTFIPRNDVLCITFDNLDIAMNKRDDRRPWGFSFIEKQGWSMMGVMANGWTWYRDPWVIEQFEELRDSGFFQRFRRVIFYGASMGGYAALVFNQVCPGAEVVAFSPQSTLDKTLVPWETRYKSAWGYDYSGPYGDAAHTTAKANRVSLFYDPYQPLDRGHIDRLSGDNLVHLRCPFFGHRLGSMMQQMGVLQPLVLRAMEGELTPFELSQTLRARQGFRRYRMETVKNLIARGHPTLAANLCRYVLKDGGDRFFRKTLAELEG